MSEETRAAEYRRQQTARAQWEFNQRYRAFPGDPAARAELTSAWEPIVNRRLDWDVEGPGDSGRGLQLA